MEATPSLPRPSVLVLAITLVLAVGVVAVAIADPVTNKYCNNCALPHDTAVTDGTHNQTLRNQIHAYVSSRFGIKEAHGGNDYYNYVRDSPGYVDINHPAFYSKALCYNGSHQANIVVDFCEYTKKGGT